MRQLVVIVQANRHFLDQELDELAAKELDNSYRLKIDVKLDLYYEMLVKLFWEETDVMLFSICKY